MYEGHKIEIATKSNDKTIIFSYEFSLELYWCFMKKKEQCLIFSVLPILKKRAEF